MIDILPSEYHVGVINVSVAGAKSNFGIGKTIKIISTTSATG